MSGNFENFDEFWPHYLREHSDPTNRTLHTAGTLAALGILGAATARRSWKLALLAPVVGYGAAWIGHFAIEKNRPATFGNPLWSLQGDLKMAALNVTGKLDEELHRLGIEDRASLER